MSYQPSLFVDAVDVDADDTDGWCTPDWLIELAREFFGGVIDLDPCSNALATVGASTSYTIRDDGLARPWSGRVWVNPPYSAPDPWMRRCVELLELGAGEALALPKGDWSPAWWRAHVLPAPARCQLHDRVAFIQRKRRTVAPFPSAVICYSWRVDDFARIFGGVGEIVRRAAV